MYIMSEIVRNKIRCWVEKTDDEIYDKIKDTTTEKKILITRHTHTHPTTPTTQ
ncbi:MAG: hypothetical protein KAU03_00995 [Candidatus Altiarchaeales archaeon]|nr:hypothetical protein [Candidatus Altiarchaeales archaeon]